MAKQEPQAAPRKYIERQGSISVPYTKHYPEIRCGVCEYCGIKDPNQPSWVQYQLCDHFRDIGPIRCSYCDETKNPDEVIISSTINVHEHPQDPNKLVVVCNSYDCSQKHIARFQLSK